jgi:AcrR family transcriptional regulator
MAGTKRAAERSASSRELLQMTPRQAEILDVASALIGEQGMRTSIEQIAEACDMQAGSLYHHFASKDEICLALVMRYAAELDGIAEQASSDVSWTSRPPLERIALLGTTMADCAIQNRAAQLLTLCEPPAGGSLELADASEQVSRGVRSAMHATVQIAGADGAVREGVDLDLLSEYLSWSMLRTALGVYPSARAGHRVAAMKCEVLLHGITHVTVDAEELDASSARAAANEAIDEWGDEEGHETSMRIRAAARDVFARSGYELTTVRDIAQAAGLSHGGVYRHIESKNELFWSIMQSFSEHVAAGWNRVMSAPSTPLEHLDGLAWLLANSMDRFALEYKMQLVGVRYAPPTRRNLSSSYRNQLRRLKCLIETGVQHGDFELHGLSTDLWPRCIMSLISLPENVVRTAGPSGALRLVRDTVMRGGSTAG